MAWTAPATWSDGVVVSAADLNNQVRDNLRYLKGLDGVPYIENAIELPESAAPTTPASGRGRLYVGNSGVNNGVASCVDDAGTAYQMVRYATGTFTPAFTGSGTAGAMTYFSQTGRYTRIGNICAVRIYLEVASISVSPTGDLNITGLPFTHVAGYYSPLAVGYLSNFNLSANCVQLGAYVDSNSTTVRLMEIFDNAGNTRFPASSFQASGIILSGTYEIA